MEPATPGFVFVQNNKREKLFILLRFRYHEEITISPGAGEWLCAYFYQSGCNIDYRKTFLPGRFIIFSNAGIRKCSVRFTVTVFCVQRYVLVRYIFCGICSFNIQTGFSEQSRKQNIPPWRYLSVSAHVSACCICPVDCYKKLN